MGNNKPQRAKRFAKYGIIIQTVHFFLTLIPVYIAKSFIIHSFSVDDEVEEQLGYIFPLFMIATLLDSSQVMITGLMRAIGKEHYSSISFIFTYVILGITSAYTLAYPCGLKLSGIWIGSILSSCAYNVLQLWEMKK